MWGGLTAGIAERGGLIGLPGSGLIPSGDFYLVVADTDNSADKQAVIDWLISEARFHDEVTARFLEYRAKG